MKTHIVRDAVQTDAEGLSMLMAELGYPTSAEDIWSRIRRMSSPTQRTFLAEVDGCIAGFAGCSLLHIYESDAPICWVMALSVATRFRRRGIGRFLLAEIERWCHSQGVADIRLNSGDHRRGAHAFYKACGFHRVGLRFKK